MELFCLVVVLHLNDVCVCVLYQPHCITHCNLTYHNYEIQTYNTVNSTREMHVNTFHLQCMRLSRHMLSGQVAVACILILLEHAVTHGELHDERLPPAVSVNELE